MSALRRSLVCVLITLTVCTGAALLVWEPAARAATADTSGHVTVVLQDGTEVIGELVEERADAVVVKTVYGQMTLARSKIREIRRENPYSAEFDERFAEVSGSVAGLLKLAAWAREKGLEAERQRAFRRVVDLNPEHREARRALGHARLDAKWVDAKRVDALLADGWIIDGIDLVEPGSGGTGVSDAEPSLDELPPAEQNALKRARKAVTRYRKKKEAQYQGVPWEDRHRITSKNFEIHCNSTRRVAEVYRWIMEALFRELDKFFEESNQRHGRTKVYIYATQQQFMDETNNGRGTGAFYSIRDEEIHAYHGTFGASATTLATLAHECVHYFQGRKLGAGNMGRRLPRWYTEGMAVYLGDDAQIDPIKKRIRMTGVPRDRLLQLQRRIRAGTHEKLKDLIRVGVPNGTQYADAWAFIHYLAKGPKKNDGQKMLASIWLLCQERAVKPKDIEDLAARYFGSLQQLESEIVEYVMELKPDPSGEVDGNTYTSSRFKFSIDRPSDGWFFQDKNEDPRLLLLIGNGEPPAENDEKAEAPKPGDAAQARRAAEALPRVEVILYNKFDPLMADEQWFEELTGEEWQKYYEKLDQDVASFKDRDVNVVTYKDRVRKPATPPGQPGQTPAPPGEAQPQPQAADAPVQMQHCTYYFLMCDRAFLVRGSAPVAEFSQYTGAFRRIAKSLSIRLEQRW